MKVVMVKDLSDYFGKNISLVKQDFPNGMVVYGLVADFSSYDLNWVSFSFDASNDTKYRNYCATVDGISLM